MQAILFRLARTLRPEIRNQPESKQIELLVDTIGVVYSGFLATAGLVWLLAVTDWALLADHLPLLAFLLTGLLVLIAFGFAFYVEDEDEKGSYSIFSGTLMGVLIGTAIWLLGPSGLWLGVLPGLFFMPVSAWLSRPLTPEVWWSVRRNYVDMLSFSTFWYLLLLLIYEEVLGGGFPIPSPAIEDVGPALLAVGVAGWASAITWGYIFYIYLAVPFVRRVVSAKERRQTVLRLLFYLGAHNLLLAFAAPAAALYQAYGFWEMLLYLSIFFIAAVLTNRLSQAIASSLQRGKELRLLTELSRALLDSPPDGSQLRDILADKVPGLFLGAKIQIQRLPDKTLLHHPAAGWQVDEGVWKWLATRQEPLVIKRRDPLPWGPGQIADNPQITVPILDPETRETVGGILLYFDGYQGAVGGLSDIVPGAQSLAAQIAAAWHSVTIYQRTLAAQRLQQEMDMAGEVQAAWLSKDMKPVEGYTLAIMLESALQASGDFFDVIELPDDRLALVVADVSDKGMGAALFMALSRTLIRTYAFEHPDAPETVMLHANQRMLTDTPGDQFVTVFYAVLDKTTGRLCYANAGHNPPYLLNGGETQALKRTGIPLGMMEDMQWKRQEITLAPGDVLVAYTDGVNEAHNPAGDLFGDARIIEVAEKHRAGSAGAIQDALLAAVHEFAGEAPQSDDITMLVLVRNSG